MTPHEKISELRKIINQQLLPLFDSDFILLDCPYHKNLGDTLIWGGEINFYKQLKYKCLFFSDLCTFYKQSLSSKTIICLHGGGNFGDLWQAQHTFA